MWSYQPGRHTCSIIWSFKNVVVTLRLGWPCSIQFSLDLWNRTSHLVLYSAPKHPWPFCRLRARRALMPFNNVLLRIRRAPSPLTLYSDSILLVLNRMYLWTVMPFWLSTDSVFTTPYSFWSVKLHNLFILIVRTNSVIFVTCMYMYQIP